MAKLSAPKKPNAPKTPKKPTSRSKTGNAQCSEAASNWQLSLRGKASLDPETYRTLAKCRAMSSTAKKADAYGRTGKLSDQGAAALKGRIQQRFDSGLITQKARTERLEMLLKQRGERGVVAKSATSEKQGLLFNPGKSRPQMLVEQVRTSNNYEKQKTLAKTRQGQIKRTFDPVDDPVYRGDQRKKNAIYATGEGLGLRSQIERKRWANDAKKDLAEKRSERSFYEAAHRNTHQPARYSLGGQLAPGRGTEERSPSYMLNVGNSIDRSGKLVPGYAAKITGTDPKYKLKREFLPLKGAKDGGLAVSQRGLYESRGPSTSIFGTDRANKPTEKEYILIGRKKVRNLVDFQAERAARLMERFRKS